MKINFQHFAFLTIALFIFPNFTNAAYLASDLLGQLDVDGNPVYTGSIANNGEGGPSPRGMSAGVRQPAIDFIHHRLFFADYNAPNSRVLVFNLDENNNLIDRVADNVLGQPSLIVSNLGLVTQSSTYSPSAIEYDPVRNYLYVSQYDANRVLVFDVANITDGEDAIYVLGQPDFITATGTTTQNGMSTPWGLAYDSEHSLLFVAQRFNNRVQVFDFSSGITNYMNASYVLGQPDFITATGTTTQNGMSEGGGMDYDSENNRLFVFDRSNARILVYDLSSGITNGMNASYVLGATDFITASAGVTQSKFSVSINDIKYDTTTGQLFVADGNNRRILIFNALPSDISNGANAVAVIGHSDFVTNTDNIFTQSGIPNAGGVVYDPGNNRLYVGGARRTSIFNFVKLTATNPSNATLTIPYSQNLTTTQSQGTVSYAVTSGALPDGLTLNSTTGEISGTPTVAGTYTFTAQATDDNGAIGYFLSQPQEYILLVEEPRSSSSGSRPSRARTTTVPVTTESVTTPATQVVELTTPSTCTITSNILKLNFRGTDVSCLQQKLNTLLTLSLDTDGIFGPLTMQAVVNFQTQNNLVTDGVVGPMTKSTLTSSN